ncbi:MAG: DUF1592 domain-containing protein [Myxococcales bacterium]|nr:DUF1592 domain-containing protein [Myxococcales bacterium]
MLLRSGSPGVDARSKWEILGNCSLPNRRQGQVQFLLYVASGMVAKPRWTWIGFVVCTCAGIAGCVAQVHGGSRDGTDPTGVSPEDREKARMALDAVGLESPGRVALHRLNNLEYDNTIRDLLGLEGQPSEEFAFPSDPHGAVFYNDALALGFAPLHVEQFLAAARELSSRALAPSSAATRQRIMVCAPPGDADADVRACAKTILVQFTERAFRRPVTDDDVAPYVDLVASVMADGESFDAGIRFAVEAVLVSPDFLFRVENDPEPGVAHPLSSFELASRLSYFLWSSMPDASLFESARSGRLGTEDGVRAEIRRMLADEKASTLPRVLADQWMAGNELRLHDPAGYAGGDYAAFTSALRDAMEEELRLFVEEIVRGASPVMDLLEANYTFANKSLATHYGISNANPLGASAERVALTGESRGGVLRQGAFLVGTSHNSSTSPTKRGKWILERLLCSPPPPAPGNVPSFEPSEVPEGALRDKLEASHTARGGECQGCHAILDPNGFALENYDAIGAWRDDENGYEIRTDGTVPGSDVTFEGPADMGVALAADPRFRHCVAEQLLSYAMGRSVTSADKPGVDFVTEKLNASGGSFPDLVEWVGTSPLMMMREGEE